MKFSLLMNIKKPTIVGSFIIISREMFMVFMIRTKKLAVAITLRFISRTNFMHSCFEHENKKKTHVLTMGLGWANIKLEEAGKMSALDISLFSRRIERKKNSLICLLT